MKCYVSKNKAAYWGINLNITEYDTSISFKNLLVTENKNARWTTHFYFYVLLVLKYIHSRPAHACNPSVWGSQEKWITWSEVWDQPRHHSETLSLLKITKISRAWWRVPVISATPEAEAEELLVPGRWRLQWAKITPLHSSLGDIGRLCLKIK